MAEPQRLDLHELWLQSTDQENTPHMAMRGMLYWTGTAWAKWTGSITVDLGTNSGVHAEDSAHTSGDEGMFALAVRNDAVAPLTSHNGDYSPIGVTSTGAVMINDAGGSITVDGVFNNWDDNNAANTFPKPYAERYAINTVDGDISYHGWAAVGTLTSAASWRIRRIIADAVTAGDATIEWADGDSDFDNIWDNRQALTYS